MRDQSRIDDDRVVLLASARRLAPPPDGPSPSGLRLRAGGSGQNPPFSFPDPATNGPRGIAVDLLNAVAAELGMAIDNGRPQPQRVLDDALAGGEIDILADAAPLAVAGDGGCQATHPWFAGAGDSVWVREDDSASRGSIADFRGRAVGALAGSSLAPALFEKHSADVEVRTYRDPDRLARAVRDREVAGGVVEAVSAAYALFQRRHPGLVIPRSYAATLNLGELHGFRVAPSAVGRLPDINAALARLMVAGVVTGIFAAYGLVWPRAEV